MNRKPSKRTLKFLQVYGERQPSSRFWYVNIHPLADEKEVLERLGMRPEECLTCDLWWAIDSNVAFVGIESGPAIEPKVYFHKEKPTDAVSCAFTVRTRCAPLDLTTVEKILGWLSNWMESHGINKYLWGKYRLIADDDIGIKD